MSERFRNWLQSELHSRQWSQSELSRRAGISQSSISNVLAGNKNPGPKFVTLVALALGESPENLLSMAGIRPPESRGDSVADQVLSLLDSMTSEQRRQVLDFIRFIKKGGG